MVKQSGNKQRAAILAKRRDLSGADVRRLRVAAEITQEELAEVLGVSRRSMIRVEQEDRIPRLVTAALIGIGLVKP